MITIACVLRTGGNYRFDDVRKLHSAVSRHLTEIPFEFVCLSNFVPDTSEIHTVPLITNWPGWWAKMELFRQDIFTPGQRVFYIDLDTIILGRLEPIVEALLQKAGLIMLRDFYRPHRPASGVMGFTAGTLRYLFDEFAVNPEVHIKRTGALYGDQQFIESKTGGCFFWQDIAPSMIYSYKVHCSMGPPSTARIVCFHGKPKPADVHDEWVRMAWR